MEGRLNVSTDMNNHRTTIVGSTDAWQAKCTCGWRSSIGSRADADDDQIAHVAHVNRARAGLRRQPTIGEALAWYSQQAANTANTPEEREQWERLAQELRPRVEGSEQHDTPLWE